MKLKQRVCLSIAVVLVALAAINSDLIAQSGRMITTTGVSYVRYFVGWFGVQNNNIGTTSTRGLSIDNNTPAAAGAQQYSPMVCQEGQGWKTNATAGSQSVEFCWEVQPVQGTANPSGNFILKASINGGAFSTVGTFTSGGSFSVSSGAGLTSLGVDAGTANAIYWAARAKLRSPADGNFRVLNDAQTNTYDITLADWGTTLSAESISVVSGGVLFLGAAPFGTLEVQIGTDNRICRFELVGTSNATVEERDGGNICSAAKDTAISINVYYDAAGASGAGYYLQNLRGGTRAVRLALIGA